MDKRLAECQRVIGYHFANGELLEVALTHSSLRAPDRECNERLEFLGDSVLGMVITEELYRLLPDQAEGELTRIKSVVVSRGALYKASTRLGLARFAQFARGVGRRNELPVSVIANLVESVIGAIYLDSGYFPAREFVLRHLGQEMDDVLNDRGAKNHKSLLQHEVQGAGGTTPTYKVIEEDGPNHRKQFLVGALIGGREWGRASGDTKKEAEQESARKALEAWQRRGRGRRRRRRGGGANGGEARAPEPRAEPKIEPRPEPSPQPRRKPRPEPRREPRREPRPEPRPEPRREPRREPRPEPGPEPGPEPRPEDRPRRRTRRRSPTTGAAPGTPADPFVEGLEVDAPPVPPRPTAPAAHTPPEDAPVRKAPARKRAPPRSTPREDPDGFDAGL